MNICSDGTLSCVFYAINALFWFVLGFPMAVFWLWDLRKNWDTTSFKGWFQIMAGSLCAVTVQLWMSCAAIVCLDALVGLNEQVLPMIAVLFGLQVNCAIVFVFPAIAPAYGVHRHPPFGR